MALIKHRIGEFIELVLDTNSELQFGSSDVMGMTITKEVIPTKANVGDTDLTKFIVVQPGDFIFNPRTHGKRIGFGYNDTGKAFIISWNNVAFRIKESMERTILADYLFLHFNRSEWDREACYNSWGSSTEVFSWDALCDMEIELPSLAVQQKYVNIYNAMLENQRGYERGLEDLKLVCDGYIEDLSRKMHCVEIGPYLTESDHRNTEGLTVESVRGLATSKEIIPTKADMNGVGLSNYKTVAPGQIAYVPDTSRRGDKVSLGLNESDETYLVSSISVVFSTNSEVLLPEYLMMFLTRSEFDRYARYNSWGSARETFNFPDMCEVKIPLPEINIQRAIVEIFAAYRNRKAINEQLKIQIKDICPILIKGSIEEARKEA